MSRKDGEGRVIYAGDDPPHVCKDTFPGRYELRINAIWQCACGKFFKLVKVYDWDGFPDNKWKEVKNAKGEEWRRRTIPPDTYITGYGWFKNTCKEHGKVSKKHRHTERY